MEGFIPYQNIRPFIAICPPAPPFHRPLWQHEPLPSLPPHGPPFPVWVRGLHEEHAVVATRNENGNETIVARAYYEGVPIPARVEVGPYSSAAIVSWAGHECVSYDYEILVLPRGRSEWIEASDGEVPANALPVSEMLCEETAFAARARVGDKLILGRLLPSEGACMVVHDNQEVAVKNYEVLCIF